MRPTFLLCSGGTAGSGAEGSRVVSQKFVHESLERIRADRPSWPGGVSPRPAHVHSIVRHHTSEAAPQTTEHVDFDHSKT